jgi:hypothetical protein
MSVEQLETAIKALPPEERERFAGWFDDHRQELIRRREIDDAQQREVLTRLEEMRTNPELLEPFEEKNLEQMLRDVANTKTQARRR